MNLPLQEFTILLVDDREENLVALQAMLAKEGRDFMKATSGNEALKLLLKHDNIGLVMLDVQMPEMDGFEVARILQSNARTRDIAIVFVTAISKTEHYVLQGFQEGAVDYLQKPLDINLTRAKVNVFERLYFNQQQLKFSKAEVERINEQLERFVYIVSHDLKSPLASIITMLSIIKNKSNVKEQHSLVEDLDMVYMAGTQLSEMISSILDYSRQSLAQQQVEEVDTRIMVSEIVFLLFLPPNIKVIVSDHLPLVFTRRQKLQQVFQNLLSNAIKFIDKQQGVIEVDAEDKGNHYVFNVKDNGAGIAAKDKERIFGLFETIQNSTNGESSTGIGLNILKMLVEEQGGKIWVESDFGVSSTFSFTWYK
ncbi:MAG: hybrid sensor histidine kinase/response regulator [Chitinophagaceae bacterium]|nr:hybrid sensor histidine kinase/response regulator [Chitinophagaceae bacterium]